jgi:hypothetical protein
MATLEPIPITIRDGHHRRHEARWRSQRARVRKVVNALVLLGLGVAVGLLTASYEIDRQERAVRIAR